MFTFPPGYHGHKRVSSSDVQLLADLIYLPGKSGERSFCTRSSNQMEVRLYAALLCRNQEKGSSGDGTGTFPVFRPDRSLSDSRPVRLTADLDAAIKR